MKWTDVRYLREWLDCNSELPPETERMLRFVKLSEEVGEVAQALIGVAGQNPRKGVTHTWEDVQKELCDVIIAAMVALDTITDEGPHVVSKHLSSRVERAKLVPGRYFRPGEDLLSNLVERLNEGATLEGLAEELGVSRAALQRSISSFRKRKEVIRMRNHEGNDTRSRRRPRRHGSRDVPADAGEAAQHQENPGGG